MWDFNGGKFGVFGVVVEVGKKMNEENWGKERAKGRVYAGRPTPPFGCVTPPSGWVVPKDSPYCGGYPPVRVCPWMWWASLFFLPFCDF